jgi:hypothetical protein
MRINEKDAYIWIMKDRLNITVDERLLEKAKRYAAVHHISLSRLVADYFERLTRPAGKKNILEIMDAVPKSAFKAPEGDLQKQYLKDNKGKYGF